MPETPRISVVLPVFNAAATLSECLHSIASQSETNFECVMVHDGSTDGSTNIGEVFARSDPRFRSLMIAHRGVAGACNQAIAQARAPVLTRMDADDRMHSERLSAQLTAFDEHPTLDAVGTHVRYFPRDAVGPGMSAYEAWLNAIVTPRMVREEAFVECPLANPSFAWRRDRIPDLQYRENLNWPEDYDLVLRLLAQGKQLGVIPRVLHEWRHHGARLTGRDPAYGDEQFIACKAHYLSQGFLARHATYHLWGYGRTGRLLAKALRRHGKRPAQIVEMHPGRIGQTIQGAAVIPPAALGPPRGIPLLVCVAGTQARSLIRQDLVRMGWRPLVDTLCAA